MLRLELNSRATSLRSEFKEWLKVNPPPQIAVDAPLDEFVRISRNWQKTLGDARWIGVHWSEEFGGRGYSLLEEAVIQECLGEAFAPQLVGMFGLSMVGPVIIKSGNSEQKTCFLNKILTANEIWCQGFSEPNAGSDLASVKTSARLENGKWIINGQKVWTSFAQYADWIFLLARTGEDRYNGLTYFLIPMTSKGITIRPLKQITGEAEFNEVFFDDVEIPENSVVGTVGEGWKIAIKTLMYERVVLTFVRHLQSEKLIQEISTKVSESNRNDLKVKLRELVAESDAVRALALAHLSEYDKQEPGPEGSYDKLGWSESFQRIAKFGFENFGDATKKESPFSFEYLYSRGRTIAAGTSEIQKEIIADRVLKLAKD